MGNAVRGCCTLATQIDKVKKRFALEHVVLVGDRGMITQARIAFFGKLVRTT